MTEARYTPDAQRAVMIAQDEARGLGHPAVGAEHLLLGLLGLEDGAVARALGGLGLTADAGRAEVERILGRGARTGHGSIPFHPGAQRVLERAFRESMSLGHEVVGAEHLVLALLADPGSVAGQVLATAGDAAVVRDRLLDAMGEPAPEGAAAAPVVGGLPDAVSVRLGEDVRALLRRAAGHALTDDAAVLSVDHVRRALEDG